MHLVHGPEIDLLIGGQRVEFFCALPVSEGLHARLPDEGLRSETPHWRNKRRHCRGASSMRCFFAGIPTSSSHPKDCPTTPPHSVCFAQLLIRSDNMRLLGAKTLTSPPGQFIPHWSRCLACLNCATLTGQEASARATRSNGYQRTCCWPPPGILSAHATKLKAPYATQPPAALPSATVNRRPRPGAKLRIHVRRGPWAAAWRSFGAFALARVSMKAELDRRSHRRSPSCQRAPRASLCTSHLVVLGKVFVA